MKESSSRTSTGWNATFLRYEIIGIASAASVGEEEAPLSSLVEVEPGHITGADTFILDLGALV